MGALRLPDQALHGLQRSGLPTVGAVARLSDTESLAIPGIGPATVAALRADLAARYHEEPDGCDR